jgi:hypothetical protein
MEIFVFIGLNSGLLKCTSSSQSNKNWNLEKMRMLDMFQQWQHQHHKGNIWRKLSSIFLVAHAYPVHLGKADINGYRYRNIADRYYFGSNQFKHITELTWGVAGNLHKLLSKLWLNAANSRSMRSLEFVDMSTTAWHAGIIVLDAYPLADNGCCSQNADASYIIKIRCQHSNWPNCIWYQNTDSETKPHESPPQLTYLCVVPTTYKLQTTNITNDKSKPNSEKE